MIFSIKLILYAPNGTIGKVSELLSQILAVLKDLWSAIWEITDTQAAIKYFFDTLRNLMVTAAIGLTAKISGSDSLNLIYAIAIFLLGFQVSSVVLNRIEMFSKPHLSPIWLICGFYIFGVIPLSIQTNAYIQRITNQVVDAQFNDKKNDKREIKKCYFTVDLNKFACPTETGVSR